MGKVMGEDRKVEQLKGRFGKDRARRFYSWGSIFLGLVTTAWALGLILGERFLGSVVLDRLIGVVMGAIGLYQLSVEIRGPLIALEEDGITVREFALARFEKIAWDRIQEVKGRGRQVFRVAVLVLRDGGEVEVPIYFVLLPKPDDLIGLLKARFEEHGEIGETGDGG